MTSLSSPTAINRCRKTELLNTVSTQLGLNTNRSKTKIMKAKTKNNNTITLEATERDTLVHIHEQYNKKMEAQKKTSKQEYRKQELHSSCCEKFGEQTKSKLTPK
ncbi:hypothetical protein NP493_1g00012 [Ridgeia piscesae]|uniref:Uncharacterized protein n=1 Tax=Ridgeia piscesae TaxID=27915 RepID=A0AAD9UM08_RIDPI|nr:hypothetical protein NP493_1g00012 [Ridgeia piscesae]